MGSDLKSCLGSAILEFESGKCVEMKEGDYIMIPKECKHRVHWTDPDTETFWIAIFFPVFFQDT